MGDAVFDGMIDHLKEKLSHLVQEGSGATSEYTTETKVRHGDVELVMTLSLELREASNDLTG